MKRFVVRVQAGDPKETRQAREVRQVVQRLVDTFISPMPFDGIGLHDKGCKRKNRCNLCDGSGGIPGGLIFAVWSPMTPEKKVRIKKR